MPVLFYSAEAQMAVSDTPMFPSESELKGLAVQSGDEILTLQDWQTYFVKFYGDEMPWYFPLPDARQFTQRCFPGQLFEISFRNTIGRTRIGPVKIRVESRKISEPTYEAMLTYIADRYANLVFSFAKPLGQNYRKQQAGKDNAYIEYLFLKRFLLDGSPDLNAISALLLANPHIKIYRKRDYFSIDAATTPKPAMLLNLFTTTDPYAALSKGHPLRNTSIGRKIAEGTGRSLFPTRIDEERKILTVDTSENRFVKYFLQSVLTRLYILQQALNTARKGYLNLDIELNLETMIWKIDALLADPLWHDVGTMTFIPYNSQVLQKREGYRQLFQLYSLMQLASESDFFDKSDFRNLLETKDTPTLFEYWSFFVIKEVLDSMVRPIACGQHISNNALERNLNEGLCITYEQGITLWFNKSYSGSFGFCPGDLPSACPVQNRSYSHPFRPDIVIEKGARVLIFDAKFKGGRGGFYGENDDGTVTTWKDEDIDKMHCYREAISGVTGAYIVYPGVEALLYKAHDAAGKHEGVGALPLKPMSTARPDKQHLDWIGQVIKSFIS